VVCSEIRRVTLGSCSAPSRNGRDDRAYPSALHVESPRGLGNRIDRGIVEDISMHSRRALQRPLDRFDMRGAKDAVRLAMRFMRTLGGMIILACTSG
jgi:hypothetical protein